MNKTALKLWRSVVFISKLNLPNMIDFSKGYVAAMFDSGLINKKQFVKINNYIIKKQT